MYPAVDKKMVNSFINAYYNDPNQPLQLGYITVGGSSPHRSEIRPTSKLVGLLFSNPKGNFVKNEITPFIDQFHLHSSYDIDIFFAGFSEQDPQNPNSDAYFVKQVNGRDWQYSDKDYNRFRSEMEFTTKWRYSGETELILLTAKKRNGILQIDFSEMGVLNLETLQANRSISSVRSLFTDIINASKTTSSLTDLKSPRIPLDILKE